MFTGIVEEVGKVQSVSQGHLRIDVGLIQDGSTLGDSVAVNGVDLTITNIEGPSLMFDVMLETYRQSNLGDLESGDLVNLERSVRADSRLSGHIVRGVVEETGELVSRQQDSDSLIMTYRVPPALLSNIVVRGPVCVDGVSLTVITKDDETFTTSIVAYTQKHTTLGNHKPGDTVNVETDVLLRYVRQVVESYR